MAHHRSMISSRDAIEHISSIPASIARELGAKMDAAGTLSFVHRYSKDGKVESICLECLTTIGRSRNVMRALEEEAAHICQPELLMAPVPAEESDFRYASISRESRKPAPLSRKPNSKVDRYALAAPKASRG
jgi:hypothetical protein